MENSVNVALNTEMSVLTVNKMGFIVSANDHFSHMAGYECKELVGRHYTMMLHPDIMDSISDKIDKIIQHHESWAGYLKTLTKEGLPCWTHTVLNFLATTGELLFISRKAYREEIRLLGLE